MLTEVGLLVIGAGPTGLGAARRLAERGRDDWLVLEATDRVGGLARSITNQDGFTFDIGGHVLFGGDPRHREAMDEALRRGFVEIERQAWVWMHDRYLPYPFQHHLRYLDPDVVYECVVGLLRAQREGGESTDFAGWIDCTFGEGMGRHFMHPYNRKVWATDLDQMSAGWIADRVAVVDAERVLRNVLLGEDASDWGPNACFRYPARGGTGAIYEALADPLRSRIAFCEASVSVDPERHTVTTSTGRTIRYDRLLSSAPLPRLISAMPSAPPEVRRAAGRLRGIGTHVVGIGLDRPSDPSRNWVYYPEAALPFHRVTHLSNYSPHLTPRPDQTLLLVEVSQAPEERMERVPERVLEGLERCGLLAEDDRRSPATVWHHFEPLSYPVPTLDRDEALAVIEPWLARHGIASRGRLGSWKYEIGNMDHAFLQGWEWVDHVLDGSRENVWQTACE